MGRKMVADLFLCRLELFGSELELVPGKIQIVRAVDGHQVHMGVWNLEADNGYTATITRKGLFYGFCNRLGKHQDLTQIIFGHVEEFVDLDLGYDERMSFAQRKDIQERKELIVFGYLIRGYLSGYDL